MKPRIAIAIAVAVLLLGAVGAFLVRRGSALPEPGSAAYEQVTRAFYHGLAALEVGLLDDARTQFTRATELVAEEPASWANLGIAQLRLGELDAAAAPVTRALTLEPDNAALVLIAARIEIARGRLDEGVAHLRRAVELDPGGLRTRFALAEEVERSGAPNADAEALALLDQLAGLAPDNPAVLLERARLAAKAGDAARLNDSAGRLEAMASGWPAAVQEQLRAFQEAASAANYAAAGRGTLLMRNLLAAVPSFRESLGAVRTPTELVAEPLDRFVRLTPPPATPSPPDMSLAFGAEPLSANSDPTQWAVFALPAAEGPPTLFTGSFRLTRLDGTPGSWPIPALPDGDRPTSSRLASIDWNHDFRNDIIMAGPGGGVQLLLQDEDGGFTDGTPASAATPPCGCFGVWAADVEMDGDLDAVVAREAGGPFVLRNLGTGAWTAVEMFSDVPGAIGFAWADLDGDADPDAAFVDRSGRLHAFANRQAGEFVRVGDLPSASGILAMTVADLDSDGVFDIVTLDNTGMIDRLSRRGSTWTGARIAAWDGFPSQLPEFPPGWARLLVEDLDNNGALDLVAASSVGGSRVWLSNERHELQPLPAPLESVVYAAADLDGDGRVDLVGTTGVGVPESRAVRLVNRGSADYHWKVIRPRATSTTGDQRINSFGVGGDIQVRSGLLTQKQLLTGGPVHIGLGDHTAIDVARIVWPNGVAQAEFGVAVDDTLVAEQRLKGSCPWVFAWDGTRMAFVTDFLWRSPLGLRINAQDTAGVVQTEDWVRIRGDQLAAKDGRYDVRITAELWETHYFDHVSLMAVDHPGDTEVYVDERFSAASPPAYTVQAVRGAHAVEAARDHNGRDVTDLVASRDGRYLATFERGRYQGIAEEHFVEFSLPPASSADSRLRRAREGGPHRLLMASGWIYPTDSSINVAIGQGGRVRPSGLALEARGADGRWKVVEADLGFPAGKNKTILIDLSGVGDAPRLRLRTNLEIAWDSLLYAEAVDTPLEITRLPAASAELRYRGFSETTSPRGESPETPHYDRIANRTQRWRDLEGYHTRFGDVEELLASVDDRYVIMNAGDEMRLGFAEPPAPRDGWRRDFVLIGDGWEKDGDYNTGYSQTVLPLPSHDRPEYGAATTSLELEDDPVYQRHRQDWETYHTRYVTPAAFIQGLRRR